MTTNIIQTIFAAMQDEEADIDDQSTQLIGIYNDASSYERSVLDAAFVCLCGWSLETLIAGEAR